MADLSIVHTYVPYNVIISWNGIIFTGFAEDTFLTISRSGNAFDTVQGADGTIARANKNASNFTLKCSILQTSPTNDLLLSALNLDINTNTTPTMMTIKEINTGTLAFEAVAWIEKDPDGDWGNKVGSREWTFRTGQATYTYMGAV